MFPKSLSEGNSTTGSTEKGRIQRSNESWKGELLIEWESGNGSLIPTLSMPKKMMQACFSLSLPHRKSETHEHIQCEDWTPMQQKE